MREILFRGKTDKSEWLYGDLINVGCDFETAKRNLYEHNGLKCASLTTVIPETVGQYTGLTDKNGKKIFEGDILEFSDRFVVVTWHEFCACWDCTFLKYINGVQSITNDRETNKWHENALVIGNIHDNPELLKGGV